MTISAKHANKMTSARSAFSFCLVRKKNDKAKKSADKERSGTIWIASNLDAPPVNATKAASSANTIQPLSNPSPISPTCTLRSPLPTIFVFTSSFFAAQHLNRLGGLQVRQAFSNVSVHRLMAPRTQQVSSLTSCSCRKSELPNTLSGGYCGLSTVNWFRLEIAKDLSPSNF